jgi:hypothetical protein
VLLNRQIQVKLVKPAKATDDETTSQPPVDLEKVGEVVSSTVVTTGAVVVGAVSAIKLVDCLCKIAINVTNPANWR